MTNKQGLEHRRLTAESQRNREEMETLLDARSRALEQNNTLLEELLDALPVGVLAIDAQDRITRTNAECRRLLGMDSQAILGRPALEEGVPPQCLERQGPATARRRGPRTDSDGRPMPRRTLHWGSQPFASPCDSATSVVVTVVDVSAHAHQADKIARAKREIETVFDSITDATYVLDKDLRIVRANRALALLVGKPFQEIIGHPCSEVLGNLRHDCARCCASKVIAEGRETAQDWKDKDGRVFRTYVFPIHERDGVSSAVLRIHDLTAERAMEQRVLQSEKMASIGQLAAGVAHEINNPVGFILSNMNRLAEYANAIRQLGRESKQLLEGVLSRGEDPLLAWRRYGDMLRELDVDFLTEDMPDLVAESTEGAERVRKIVADLKAFSHPGDDEPQYADLNECIESTLNIARNEIKYKCEVVRDFDELPQVLCWPRQINQVILNLLVNAAQAIVDRGTITLRTRSDSAAGRVSLSVSDTGKGILPEHQTKIFDPFFTTKPVGQGTGLGLHLAAGIVSKHGGEISVESHPGEGSTFTVVLPLDGSGTLRARGREP